MLISLGIRPVASLVPPFGADVAQAVHTLDEITRECQSRGWHWNTLQKTIEPDANNGKLLLGPDVLRIDAVDPWFDVAQDGDYLVDKATNSDVFTNPVTVTMVVLKDWERMPEPARGYILKRATRTLQARVQGGRDLAAPSFDEQSALSDLEDFDSESADYNIFNYYSAARILRRTGSWWNSLRWG